MKFILVNLITSTETILLFTTAIINFSEELTHIIFLLDGPDIIAGVEE